MQVYFLCVLYVSPLTDTDSNSEGVLSIVSDKSTPFTRTPASSRAQSQHMLSHGSHGSHGSNPNLEKFRQDMKVPSITCISYYFLSVWYDTKFFSTLDVWIALLDK